MTIDALELQALRERIEELVEYGEPAVEIGPREADLVLALMDEHDEMIGEDA